MGNSDFLKALALLGPTITFPAYAEVYMSPQQAVEKIFPQQQFTSASMDLSDSEAQSITKDSGDKVRSKTLSLFKNAGKDCVFIDQVLGKHEFITYAVGITAEGAVKGIEILEYRESYGHQVKRASWRAQFVGKTKSSPLKLDEDIKNISGATLSSSHVVSGVKRLLLTYDVIKTRF